MQLASPTAAQTKKLPTTKMIWIGRFVSGVSALFMVFVAVVKLMRPPAVVAGFVHYGYSERMIVPVGLIEVACSVMYLIPRTSVLGAILLTGLLGGATATNLRIGDSGFVGPVIVGILVWGGLFLRDERLRALIPLRRSSQR